MSSIQLQRYLGLSLLAILVAGFIYVLATSWPTNSKVNATAQLIPAIPSDLFSSTSATLNKINSLNTPSDVPVTVDPSSLGRTNVFQSH